MMTIAVFRSRTQVFSFVNAMRAHGVTVNVISTPQEAFIGCGLSASFPDHALTIAKLLVKASSGFSGFYKVYHDGGKRIVKLS